MRAYAYVALPVLLVAGSGQLASARSMVTANGSKPGTYNVKHADGTVTRTILNSDGNYRDLATNGKVEAEGKWDVIGGKMCFKPSTKGAQTMCFKESPRAKDGSFTATPDKGKAVHVSPAT